MCVCGYVARPESTLCAIKHVYTLYSQSYVRSGAFVFQLNIKQKFLVTYFVIVEILLFFFFSDRFSFIPLARWIKCSGFAADNSLSFVIRLREGIKRFVAEVFLGSSAPAHSLEKSLSVCAALYKE